MDSHNMSHRHLLFHASVPDAPSPSFPPSTPQHNHSNDNAPVYHGEEEDEALGAMKEMMYRIAAMQPVDIDPATVKKPRRRNVRISEDPQSVAARHRRERISERIRILQRLVPGGPKMDTASMLHEAIRYIKFLKHQLHHLQPPAASAFAGPTVSVLGRATGPCVDWAAVRPAGIGGSTSPPSSSSSMGPHAGHGMR